MVNMLRCVDHKKTLNRMTNFCTTAAESSPNLFSILLEPLMHIIMILFLAVPPHESDKNYEWICTIFNNEGAAGLQKLLRNLLPVDSHKDKFTKEINLFPTRQVQCHVPVSHSQYLALFVIEKWICPYSSVRVKVKPLHY